EIGAEIINADSMQLYAGMDIGTAKLPVAQRRGVPHHLLDIWDVRQTASVAEYQRLARDAIADIQRRGQVPVLAGGSGLYLRAALDPLEFPGTDPALRAALEAELAQAGPAALHQRLTGLDPAAAAAILPSNGRRIVRALEVIEVSGRTFSATMPEYESLYPVVQLGLAVDRAELDVRITARTERMFAAGLVEEVTRLEPARRGGGRGRRPAGRWVMPRCCGFSPGTAPWRRRGRKPSWRPSASSAGRSPGSAAIPGSPGCWPAPPTPVTYWSERWLPSGHAVRERARHREQLRDPARPGRGRGAHGRVREPAVRPPGGHRRRRGAPGGAGRRVRCARARGSVVPL